MDTQWVATRVNMRLFRDHNGRAPRTPTLAFPLIRAKGFERTGCARDQLVMRQDARGARGSHAEEPTAPEHLCANGYGHEQRLVSRVSVGTPARYFAFGSDTVFGVNAISQEHGSGGRGCMVFQNGRWHRQR